MNKQKRYSAEFKLDAVSRMEHCKTITGLAEELGIRRKFLYQWRDQLRAGGKAGLERRRGRPPGSPSKAVSQPTASAAESRIAELERLLGRKQLELDFFKRAFRASQGSSGESYQRWREGIYRSIEASPSFEGAGLTVEIRGRTGLELLECYFLKVQPSWSPVHVLRR